MKQRIIVFVFVCLVKTCFSQIYQPFPTDSAVWRQVSEWWMYPDGYKEDYNYFFQGDTILSGKAYHKTYHTGNSSNYFIPWAGPWVLTGGPYFGDSNTYAGAIREDALKHIYFFSDTASTEQLLYDFNLSVGDTLQHGYNSFYATNFVSSIDSILIGTEFHKRFNISCSGASNYVSIIEGVGSTFGLLEKLVPVFESSDDLECFTHKGITVYTDGISSTCDLPLLAGIDELNRNNSISVFPNPTKGIINVINSQAERLLLSVFNVLGEIVYSKQIINTENIIDLSQLPKGVYFLKAASDSKIVATQKIILQ